MPKKDWLKTCKELKGEIEYLCEQMDEALFLLERSGPRDFSKAKSILENSISSSPRVVYEIQRFN